MWLYVAFVILTMNEPQTCYQHGSAALTTPRYKEQGMAELQPIFGATHPQLNILPVEYKVVSGWPGYVAGSDGTVWTVVLRGKKRLNHALSDRWIKLRGSKHPFGYQQVILEHMGKKKCGGVHRIIAETFLGPQPFPGAEVRHFFVNDPTNNWAYNLRWGSHEDNVRDSISHGTFSRGSNHKSSKLTSCQVREIREQCTPQTKGTGKWNVKALAEKFGVCEAAIYFVVNKTNWKYE